MQRTEKGPVARSATPQASAGGPPEAVCGGHFLSVFRRDDEAPLLGRLFPPALHAPSALSRLAKGKTRAAPRRRSADQRPAAARSARLVAGRRIPRRAAGGSLGRHSHAAFFPQGSSPARGQQRALAGALSAIREQAPLAHDPPFNRTQVKLGRWHGRGEAVGVPQRCRGWLWASGLRRARVSSAITCLLCAAACLSGPCSSSPLSFSWPDAHRHSRVETQVCMCRVLFLRSWARW